MATQRLTNDIRASILNAILSHAFKKRAAAALETQAKFANDVFDDVYREDLPLLESSKSHLFERINSFQVIFGGQRESLSFCKGLGLKYSLHQYALPSYLPNAVPRPAPWRACGYTPIFDYEASDKMSRRYVKLMQEKTTLVDEIESAAVSAKAILQSTGSFAKLFTEWPEIKPFAQKYTGAPKPQLPAVQTAVLNAVFGLPV